MVGSTHVSAKAMVEKIETLCSKISLFEGERTGIAITK